MAVTKTLLANKPCQLNSFRIIRLERRFCVRPESSGVGGELEQEKMKNTKRAKKSEVNYKIERERELKTALKRKRTMKNSEIEARSWSKKHNR